MCNLTLLLKFVFNFLEVRAVQTVRRAQTLRRRRSREILLKQLPQTLMTEWKWIQVSFETFFYKALVKRSPIVVFCGQALLSTKGTGQAESALIFVEIELN